MLSNEVQYATDNLRVTSISTLGASQYACSVGIAGERLLSVLVSRSLLRKLRQRRGLSTDLLQTGRIDRSMSTAPNQCDRWATCIIWLANVLSDRLGWGRISNTVDNGGRRGAGRRESMANLWEGWEQRGRLGPGCVAAGASRLCIHGGSGLCVLCTFHAYMRRGCRTWYISIPLQSSSHAHHCCGKIHAATLCGNLQPVYNSCLADVGDCSCHSKLFMASMATVGEQYVDTVWTINMIMYQRRRTSTYAGIDAYSCSLQLMTV